MDRRSPFALYACLSLAALAIAVSGPLALAGPDAIAADVAAPAQPKPSMEKSASGEAAVPNNGKPMSPATTAAFDRLKSLLGNWSGITAAGHAVRVSYRLISGDTCIQETLDSSEGGGMVSIYCPDGDGLLMTHYCAANNQPRMRATRLSGDRNVLSFAFVDAANLPSDKAGHMVRLEMTFQDQDHFAQAWTYRNDGRDGTETFTYSRVNG